MAKNNKPLLGQVKDAVDFLFDATNKQGGFKGSVCSQSVLFGEVTTILVRRGIIDKKRDETHKRGFTYMWVATMHPTKTLYQSITQELRDQQRKYDLKSRAKRRPDKNTVPVVNVMIDEATNPATGLEAFPSQLLWDELKKRGFTIDGERLVKKDYLN